LVSSCGMSRWWASGNYVRKHGRHREWFQEACKSNRWGFTGPRGLQTKRARDLGGKVANVIGETNREATKHARSSWEQVNFTDRWVYSGVQRKAGWGFSGEIGAFGTDARQLRAAKVRRFGTWDGGIVRLCWIETENSRFVVASAACGRQVRKCRSRFGIGIVADSGQDGPKGELVRGQRDCLFIGWRWGRCQILIKNNGLSIRVRQRPEQRWELAGPETCEPEDGAPPSSGPKVRCYGTRDR